MKRCYYCPWLPINFFGIDSITGDAIWKDSTGVSPFISAPYLSSDGSFVYTIQVSERMPLN